MTKVYVTKYALTEGVFTINAERHVVSSGDVYWMKDKPYFFLRDGRDAFTSAADAAARVRTMIGAKKESLRRSAEKLIALDPDKMVRSAKAMV